MTALIATLASSLPYPAAARSGGISMAQTRAIALKAAPGRIEKEEREREGGAWRCSFDIRRGDRIHEFGVAISSGHVVEDKFEPLKARD
ncbi:putative membrane protein YkoI [Novosphingobium capsulatum]|uniref:Membrane protein YkoI n=1 Tax=Novosphingobium capsulatum TaxID=13688 RepID=A0ABU1MNM7_9SPHN|nr:peptidase M4 [Novosphingobium capsulatum]MDR6511934.1 putative membrane protein YkoI [Novosphingobium capsulatum]